jgi:asparagine synthetase B (glutamine-hydrolysing)
VRALPRNSCLTWRAGVLHISSTATPPAPQRLSRTSAIDGYVTLFKEAVRRRLPVDGQRVAVPLSGGRDSRLVLFQLLSEGCRPVEAVTIHHYPPKGNEDARIAPLVAGAVGVPTVVLPLDGRRVAAERRKNVMTSLCADRHVQMLPLVDHLRGRADVIYDGLGGDVLSGARFEQAAGSLSLLERGRCRELARKLLTEHSDEEALQALLHPEARRRFSFELAEARVAEELGRHLEWPNALGAYRLANRTARSVAMLPFAMLSRACRVMTPYLDRDLAGFLTSLPASALADGRLRDDAIARAFPQHAHLPYEDPSRTSGPMAGYYRRLSWALARDALSRRTSPLVRRRFLASRLAKSAVVGNQPWLESRRAVFLMQIEEVLDGVAARQPSSFIAPSGI